MDGAILVVAATDGPMPQTQGARAPGPPGRRPLHRRRAEQGRHGRRRGDPGARRARGPRAALRVRVPGRRPAGRARLGAQGARGRRRVGRQAHGAHERRRRPSIPQPEREIDKPFLMPVEDVFTITGRGTVVTGRIERGIVKVNETVDIVGIRDDQADHHGHRRRDVPQAARRGSGRRERRSAPARHQARGRRARHGRHQAGHDHPAHRVRGATSTSCPRTRVAGTRRSSTTTARSSTSAPRTSPASSRCPRAPRWSCRATTPR